MPSLKSSLIIWAIVAAGAIVATMPSGQAGQLPAVTPGQPLAPPAAKAATSSPAGVAFVDLAFPAITAGEDRTIHALVFVKNTTDREIEVSPRIVLRTASGGPIGPIEVAPHAIKVSPALPASGISLTVSLPKVGPGAFPLNGWLLLQPALSAPAWPTIGLEIKGISAACTTTDSRLLMYALLAAGAGVLIAAVAAIKRGGTAVLWHRMGSPTWSFTDSWSSNLTVAGAMVTSLLGFAGLPDQGDTFSKKTYVIVSLLLAALIGLAPGMYNLFRKTVQTKDDAGMSVVQSQGFVSLFLLAALFTMTGVLAQLGLLMLLFHDVAVAGSLSLVTARYLRDFCVGLQILLWLYAVVSIVQTIHSQSTPKDDAEGTQPARVVRAGLLLDHPAAVKQQLADWPLL